MIAIDMAVAKLSSDALEFFAVDNSRNLLSCSKLSGDPNATWSPWRSFPGTGQLLGIAAGSLSDRRALLCAADTANQLWSCSKSTTDPGSAWTAWNKVPGAPPARNLTVAQLPDGAPQLLVLDDGQQLQTCSKPSGTADATWGAWGKFPGLGPLGQVTAASLPDRRTVLWAIDVSRQLWSCWRTTTDLNSAWTTWTKVSGAPAATCVTVGTLPDGTLELFMIDSNHVPWHCWQVSSELSAAGWTSWRAFPKEGQCLCIAARTLTDGRNALWAIDTGHKLFRCIRTAANPTASWTKWAPFDGGQTDPLESPAYCQQALTPDVSQKWAALAQVQASNSGMSVREYLGSAVSSEESAYYFQRGMIFASSSPSSVTAPALRAGNSPAPIAVHGPIYLHYRELGGTSGRLGPPLADAASDEHDGMWQGFANGEMHWHPRSGAFALDKGPLLNRWKQMGGPGGLAGYPIVDEAAVVVGKDAIARLARFQNASLLLNAVGQVYAVSGDIRIAYEVAAQPG